jgi:tetratricopeptide (TPR) repeat protein
MEQWENTVSKGNHAFREGRDDDAISLYTTAYQRALILLPHWSDTEAAIAALVISYQNIADVYFRKHDYSQAINAYQDLYQQLKSYYLTHADTPTIMTIFDCACRRAGTELAAAVKRLGILNASEKELVNDFFELKSQPTFNLPKDYIQ